MIVHKYAVTQNTTIHKHLFLRGEFIYIEGTDGKHERDRSVFNSSKEYIGEISTTRLDSLDGWTIKKP